MRAFDVQLLAFDVALATPVKSSADRGSQHRLAFLELHTNAWLAALRRSFAFRPGSRPSLHARGRGEAASQSDGMEAAHGHRRHPGASEPPGLGTANLLPGGEPRAWTFRAAGLSEHTADGQADPGCLHPIVILGAVLTDC